MPLPLAAGLAIGAVGPAVAGYLGFKGQQGANRANRRMAREQMAFQERMSSTAYQRTMSDMRKSGLNPMLAYGQGGASSPGGQTATMKSETEAATSSALAARRQNSELKSMEGQRELMYNQSRLAANASAREAAQVQLLVRDQEQREMQTRILRLQLPSLENAARVDRTGFGKGGAFADRLRQMIFGGRGFFNPVGR